MDTTTRYKNWPEICQIPDRRFRLAIAQLDLESEFGQKIAKALPEYVTDEKIRGPVPLTVLSVLLCEDEEFAHLLTEDTKA